MDLESTTTKATSATSDAMNHPWPATEAANARLRAALDTQCQRCVAIVRAPNWTSLLAIVFALMIPLLVYLGDSISETYFYLSSAFALILSAMVIFFNIEIRRKTRSLAESEARYRELVTNLPGAVFRASYERKWNVVYLSDAIRNLTGLSAAALIHSRQRLLDLIHPACLPVNKCY